MRHPLLIVAAFFALGIALGDLLPVQGAIAATLALAVLAFSLGSKWPARQCLAAGVMLSGFTCQRLEVSILAPDDLRLITPHGAELVRLSGVLLEKPGLRAFENSRHERKLRAQARLRVHWIQRNGGPWQGANGEVLVTAPFEPGPEFHRAAPVEINGLLDLPPAAVAPGLFDYRLYLERQDIHRRLTTLSSLDWTRLGSFKKSDTPWQDRFEAWARATLARGLPVEDDALRLSWAMALGWKTALTDEVSEPFMKTGTMHLFAISGLHVALMAGILLQLLKGFQVRRTWSGVVIIPLLWFYTAATGWQASAIRATVMMTLVVASWSLHRPVDLLNSLGTAALAILAFDPQQLFQAGFQLSFLVVLSLAILQPRLGGWHTRIAGADPWIPGRLVPTWRKRILPPIRALDQALAVSLAAWVGSLPLTAEYFNLVTPSSFLANLVVVPLGNLALMCQLGSLLCGSWLAGLGELFNFAGWFWMSGMIRICGEMASWPGSHFYILAPGIAASLLACVALVSIQFGSADSRKRWATVGCLTLACASCWLWRWHTAQTTTRITILGLTSSHSIMADLQGRENDALIDAGSDEEARRVVGPFLHALGVNRLRSLVITHGNQAHAGGAVRLIQEMKPAIVKVPDQRFRSQVYRTALEEIELSGIQMNRLQRGDRFGPWTVLHPIRDVRVRQGDDAVTALLLQTRGVRVLLCGSAGQAAQAALLENRDELRADLFICSIPARDAPPGRELLEAIRPRHVVIVERANQLRRSAALKKRLNERGIAWHSTFESGTVQATLENGTLEVVASR